MTLSAAELLEGISPETLSEIIDTNPGLVSPLFGYVAEYRLKRYLEGLQGVSKVEKIPEHSKARGDFLVTYEGETYAVESKCVKSSGLVEDKIHLETSGVVLLKLTDSRAFEGGRTASMDKGEYDVLAVCTRALTGTWDFWFINNKRLPSSPQHPSLLATQFKVTPGVTPFLFHEFSLALA